MDGGVEQPLPPALRRLPVARVLEPAVVKRSTGPSGDCAPGLILDIPRSLENPVFLWVDDTEVIRDLIAQGVPIFWHLIAQEVQHRGAEVPERFVALVVGDVPVHQSP